MNTPSDLHKWVSSGRDFLWLRKPGQNKVLCFGLGEPQKEPTHSSVAICPFNSDSPAYYSIQQETSLDVDALPTVSFQLPTELEPSKMVSTAQHQYMEQVDKALQVIQSGGLEKVVLAQTHWLKDITINPIEAFRRACKAIDSYAYLAYVGGECWIGSSPELFLKSDYTTIETVALAGTRLATNASDAWGEKEIQEQSIVTTYLTETFEALDFSDITVGTSFTKTVGHIQHICNSITATKSNHLDVTKLLSALHPTPALAGFPKTAAKSLINETEVFSRDLYGGYIGYMDAGGMEYFVNIRCARLFNESAQLFAGAGINRDSNPQSEWEETNNKLNVIKSILV